MLFSAVLSIFLLLLPVLLHAAPPECKWVETEGMAIAEGNVTVDNVRRSALDRARHAAIEQEVGVSLFGSTLIKDSTLVNDFIHSNTEGMIIKEREPVWSTEMYVPAPGKPGVPAYTVKLSVCVAVDTTERDTGFKLSLTTSKPVYINGDEVNLKIHSTRDTFISLFHIDENDSVTLLIPSQLQKRVLIKANAAYEFPSPGVGMKTSTSPGHSRDTDFFLAVATREWFDFDRLRAVSKAVSRQDVMKTIAAIPQVKRAIAIISYDIVAR
jgi:hypothetical protein